MANNSVKEWAEFMKISEVPTLEELNFVGKEFSSQRSLFSAIKSHLLL